MKPTIDFPLLKTISETPGVSGYEGRIRHFLYHTLKEVVDELTIDNMGNLYALKKGSKAEDRLPVEPQTPTNNKSVLCAAHMDEIGYIVSHIDNDGFVHFQMLGGFDAKTHTAQRVIIHGKQDVLGVMVSKPIHIMRPEERDKAPQHEDFFIDTGYSKAELLRYVKVGDPITRQRELSMLGEQCFTGKSLDNRISVYILVEVLKKLKHQTIPYDFYAVFTVQEEVGLRGAQVAAFEIAPDFAINLDTTVAYDIPRSSPQENITRLGGGVSVKIMDAGTLCDARMIDFLQKTASKHKITHQNDVASKGGTDTAYLQRNRKGGSIAGALSIPTRNLHQTVETCHSADVLGAIQLLEKASLEIDQHAWNYNDTL